MSYRAREHEASPEAAAAAALKAARLAAALSAATSADELLVALEAVGAACCKDGSVGEPAAGHVWPQDMVTALLEAGAVPELCARLRDAVTTSGFAATGAALLALKRLLNAVAGSSCACCAGVTEPGARAVQQLAECGGVEAASSVLVHVRRPSLALTALRLLRAVVFAGGFTPALAPAATPKCLEAALLLAFGAPGACRRVQDPEGDEAWEPLAHLCNLARAFPSDTAAHLARLPATLPLLLLLLDAPVKTNIDDKDGPPQPARQSLDHGTNLLSDVLARMVEDETPPPAALLPQLLQTALEMFLRCCTRAPAPRLRFETSRAVIVVKYCADLLDMMDDAPLLQALVPLEMLRRLCALASANGDDPLMCPATFAVMQLAESP